MTPLERAARALALTFICEDQGWAPDEEVPVNYAKNCWVNHIAQVRAVLTAIREPSDAMVGPDSKAWGHAGSEAEHVWREAIDAMLEEG